MLISRCVKTKWNSKNKNRYVGLGYRFTKMGDDLYVDIKDITKSSNGIVEYMCDYCGCVYEITWNKYLYKRKQSLIEKDCCMECIEEKARESVLKKYGGYAEMYNSCNDARSQTNIEKYGSLNPFGSDEIKAKIIQSNIKKYGVPYTQQSQSVREKTVATCREKYGVDNYVELFKGKFIGEDSPTWKGGIAYSRVERACHDYSIWRKSVFSKDMYTCAKCGARNGNGVSVELQAHHIKNWKDNIDCRYDINNGITLCNKCHMKFHSIYGKKNNTLEQLEEFIGKSDKKIC